MNTFEDLKNEIEQRTGVPASLLSGETPEELLSQAKALLAYKREFEAEQPKTPAEQFADWLDAKEGIQRLDPESAALAELEEAMRVKAGGYPKLSDASTDDAKQPDPRPVREQFAEWMYNKTAYDPRKN